MNSVNKPYNTNQERKDGPCLSMAMLAKEPLAMASNTTKKQELDEEKGWLPTTMSINRGKMWFMETNQKLPRVILLWNSTLPFNCLIQWRISNEQQYEDRRCKSMRLGSPPLTTILIQVNVPRRESNQRKFPENQLLLG